MQYDFEWLSIGGQDNEVSNTSVQALGGFVGTLLQLFVELRLVAQVEDLLLQLVVSFRPGSALLGDWLILSLC